MTPLPVVEANRGCLRDHRDLEEGMSGRVYRVCRACRDREEDRLKAEADYYNW